MCKDILLLARFGLQACWLCCGGHKRHGLCAKAMNSVVLSGKREAGVESGGGNRGS